MSSIGVSGSATYAVSLSGIHEMMSRLPDNLLNQITAKDARDVVFTLYDEIQGLSSSTYYYNNPNFITNPVGNWTSNKTFSNVTLTEIFDGIFYKDSGPNASITINPSTLDFGNTQSVALSWSVTKGTHNFNQSDVNISRTPLDVMFSFGIIPSQNNSGSFSDTPELNSVNTYAFTVFDTKGNSKQASTSLSYLNRWYWGNWPTNNGVILNGGPNNSAEVRSLTSSGSGAFGTNFNRSFVGVNNIGGGNRHIVWAFPASWGTPKFTLTSGFIWTGPKFSRNISYTNLYGYTTTYSIWHTQDAYNSVYNSFIMGT